MIRKITSRGYNTSVPFKLFYLCDDDGASDLSEAFKVLLLLPVLGDEELLQQIKYWATASYKQDLTSRQNSRPYYLTGDELKEWEAEDLKSKESLNAEIHKITEQLEKDLKSTTCILVPLSMDRDDKNTLKYFGNKRYTSFKQVQKLETNIEERMTWGTPHGWAMSALERCKRDILAEQAWMKNSKLIINGAVTRHPCMLCTRALDSLEGLCAFGGKHCASNLGTSIQNSIQSVSYDSQ